jgi:hypothetical protein
VGVGKKKWVMKEVKKLKEEVGNKNLKEKSFSRGNPQ